MAVIRCPSCNDPLTEKEASNASCPACGTTLPAALSEGAASQAQSPSAIQVTITTSPILSQAGLPSVDHSNPAIVIQSGDATKNRVLAAIGDNLIAIIAAIAVASLVRGRGDITRGVIAIAGYLAYYFLSEGLLSTTPGKFIFGLSVKGLSGNSPTWLQIGIRTLLRLIEVNPIVVGDLPACITILVTRHHQRLGDLLAGTVVVSNSRSNRS